MTDTPSPRSAARIAFAPLLLSFALTVVCFLTLGPTTGVFFAGFVIVALLTPPLSVTRRDLVGQALVIAGVLDGTLLGLAVATSDPAVGFGDWLRAFVLMVAFGTALWGATAALVRLRLPPVLASATVVVLALLWLAWPIWLSPWLAGRGTLVDWLAWPHPLLSLDGALRHLGPPWTERHFMYTRLTVLNQDVFYTLPSSVWPGALVHAVPGGTLLLLSHRAKGEGKEVEDEDRG